MLDGQGGEVGVGGEIRRRPDALQKLEQNGSVALARMHDHHLGLVETRARVRAGGRDRERVCEYLPARRDPDKSEVDDPREPDRPRAVEQAFPPA